MDPFTQMSDAPTFVIHKVSKHLKHFRTVHRQTEYTNIRSIV